MGQCDAGFVPKGCARRLMYYVLTGDKNRKFDGVEATKKEDYTQSLEGNE